MRLYQLVALLGCSAAIALSSSAAAETQQSTQQSDVERIIQKYYDDLGTQKYQQALADVDALNPDASNKDGRALVLSMRAAALLGLKRDSEVQQIVQQIGELSPQDPAANMSLFESAFSIGRSDIAAEQLDEMIARYPDAVRGIDKSYIQDLLDYPLKGQELANGDRWIALARIGYSGDTGTGRWIAFEAVKRLIRRGDAAGASELLPYAADPRHLENVLIQKRYSVIWPAAEKLAGPHMTLIRASSVARAQRAFEAAPDDHEKLSEYADALRRADRLDDVVSLKAKLPATHEAMAKTDEPMGWALNTIALALAQLNRTDESDRLYSLLNEARGDTDGWRVNMVINRVDLLVQAGRFAAAEKLIPSTEEWSRDHGSPYAQQLVRQLQFCTASSLGKKDIAARLLPDLLAHSDDAMEPTVDALICGGELDRAEQLTLKNLALSDESKREGFQEDLIGVLQPAQFASGDPTPWQGRWEEFRKRPAIAAAYERLGRDMPAQLVPQTRPQRR